MKAEILICAGTSGISAEADSVAEEFAGRINSGKLDREYSIIKTGDRGLFKDVIVDIKDPEKERVTYVDVTPGDVPEIYEEHLLNGNPVKRLLAGSDYENFFRGQKRIVLENCGEITPEDIDAYLSRGGYSSVEKIAGEDPSVIIQEIKNSGLRGRGGAGFPSGLKWEFARKAPGEKKYIICNADEGDPGAFMDRSILEGDPHSVIEGMIIAAYAVGAGEGYIYCRAEYPLAIKRIKKAISQAEEKGFLGDGICGGGFSFDIKIKQGAGAFVCGEETALIASIEGRRGMPVPRPPFPAQQGLWKKPTMISNVETLANVRHIIKRGAEWFSSIGTEKSKGTKVFALAGKVKNTGLVEVPMGTTIRQLIYGPGGGMEKKRSGFKGAQIGGPSGGCLPESLLDTSIDYESITATGAIMGSGGMVVMDADTCMVDVARFFLDFTVEESCGKCVPCRVGLKRMLEVLDEITMGKGRPEHIDFLKEMSSTVKSAALCGLGSTAPNPVSTTLKYFYDEYLAHIEDKKCPSLVCMELISFEVVKEKCIKCGRCYQVCPAGAVTWEKKKDAEIDKDKCIKCRACISACPVKVIK